MEINFIEQDSIKKAEGIINELSSEASDYIKKFKEFGLIESVPYSTKEVSHLSLSEAKEKMHLLSKHQFSVWLNTKDSFLQAKKKLINKKLIYHNIDDFKQNNLFNLIKIFSLELIIANVISSCPTNDFKQFIIKQKSNETVLSDKQYLKLRLMSLNFELDAEQHLFICLIDKLKNSKGNILYAGKSHGYIVRQYIMKRIITELFNFFELNGVTHTFIADIAMEITGLFFDNEMSRADAIAMAKKIIPIFKRNREFLNSTVKELIFTN